MDIIMGLFGGLAASLVAALVFAFDDSVPFPVSLVLGRFLGERTEQYYVGFLGTFTYGIPAGVAYVYVLSILLVAGVPSSLGYLACGAAWTALLTGLFAALIGDRRTKGTVAISSPHTCCMESHSRDSSRLGRQIRPRRPARPAGTDLTLQGFRPAAPSHLL